MIAARGMINTIRAHYPELLQARDRGRDHVKEETLAYGEAAGRDVKVDENLDSSEESDDEDPQYDPALVNPDALEGWKFKNVTRRIVLPLYVLDVRNTSRKKRGGSTNREKIRKKNFNMVQQSAEVRKKLKRSETAAGHYEEESSKQNDASFG